MSAVVSTAQNLAVRSAVTLQLDDLIHERLTARDLIVALGWCLRLAKVNNELAEYWAERFRLLSLTFGLPGDWRQEKESIFLIERLALAATAPGLFSGLLEYGPAAGEAEILEEFYPAIDLAEQEVRSQAAACASELLCVRWPHLRDASILVTTLVEQGLPENVPDPIDFL